MVSMRTLLVKIFLPIWFISWAVLMPVTSVRTGVPSNKGLDIFTFGNVAPKDSPRYSAHLVLAWLFTFYILYVLYTELHGFISIRQHYLVDTAHSSTAQANTILVTGIPQKYLSEEALIHLFKNVPGGVRKVWLNHELKDLPGLYSHRLAACNKLESAEHALIKTAIKLNKKQHGKDINVTDVEESVALADRLVPKGKRPSHRLPLSFMPFALPLIGTKVDTIDWARNEISQTTTVLEAERAIIRSEVRASRKKRRIPLSPVKHEDDEPEVHNKYPALNSAFILFRQQIGAHMAAQVLSHHEPYCMVDKYIELAPDDVVWGNLGLNPYEVLIRRAISFGLTAALIIGWAIPVAFVGIVSNVAGLCKTYSWLAWLCKLPSPVVGIIQGILPAVLLAVLFILLPIILRLFARFEGIPTRTGIELSLMTRLFIFQVVHGFLVVTISSGIIAALPQLAKNPASIPSLLAQKLPSASTFFLTYIILQGLSGTAGGFLAIVALILYYVKLFILGSTPRSIFNIKYVLQNLAWGTTYPGVTLLVVISEFPGPLRLDMPPSGDTGGLFFMKAIQHTFVGLYVQQVCLCALFFLAQDAQKKASAIPEGALMVVLIAFTAFFNYILNSSFRRLLHSLPLTLADHAHEMPEEFTPPEGHNDHEDEENGEKVALTSSKPHSAPQAPTDFEHPAVREPLRPIWMAADPLGLGNSEAEIMTASGIPASTIHATIDEECNVEVDGRPPGDE
ncbi:hypothetical protein Clacol_009277 [Clathrus columnatus]|uniref:DUF221-domain-containing protein n=1 Tax=Clathrus columnatus TaxID=1419009 RepID=A0AAV5AQB5_9AGAM|nr:hypothetical protein Clacol_009277 [Clathrus columnatus]